METVEEEQTAEQVLSEAEKTHYEQIRQVDAWEDQMIEWLATNAREQTREVEQ